MALTLGRRVGESIDLLWPEGGGSITVVGIHNGSIRLRLDFPPSVIIRRDDYKSQPEPETGNKPHE